MSSNFTVKKICEHCGNVFLARTTVTRYCSKACNSKNYKLKLRNGKIEEAEVVVKKVINHQLNELSSLEFLTVKDVAKLLGASEKIVYNMIRSGRLRSTNLSVRKTVVSRNDINGLFDLPSSELNRPLTIADCYNMGEAQRVFNVSEKALVEIIKRNKIKKFQEGKFMYVSKRDLDSIFNLTN